MLLGSNSMWWPTACGYLHLKFVTVIFSLVYENMQHFPFLFIRLTPSMQFSPPSPGAGWVARLDGSWLKNILCYLLFFLTPSLNIGCVRTEVKSCIGAAWMSSQGTTDQKSQFLHFSSLSVSVFSPTFSPLFRCAECFSFCSNSPRLFLVAYVKCYHNLLAILPCPPLFPLFFPF